jgi:hypothetical protein
MRSVTLYRICTSACNKVNKSSFVRIKYPGDIDVAGLHAAFESTVTINGETFWGTTEPAAGFKRYDLAAAKQ